MNSPLSDEPSAGPEPEKQPNFATSANWQIPTGVSKGTWDYVRANGIADGYDEFLHEDPLTKVDWQIIDRYLPPLQNVHRDVTKDTNQLPPPLVADFGCGTGRTLMPIVDRGYRGLGIDLSIPMLKKFEEKSLQTTQSDDRLTLLNANLVELDGIKDNSVDHGVCMFSTLGMIEGSKHRSAFLEHVRRVIKPDGQFIVHAHNVWYQLRFPGGTKWLAQNAWASLRGKSEFGDRLASYRGVNQMFIHSFRKNELQKLIATSGFQNQTWFGVEPNSTGMPVELGSRLSFIKNTLNLVGWIIVCR